MARRKVIWTIRANKERKEALKYWQARNHSKAYSKKLNILIIEAINRISEHPNIGRKTDYQKNIRVILVRDYLLFYQIREKEVLILSLWYGSKDTNELDANSIQY